MALYIYTGPGERIYPDIITDHGSLVVNYGDECEFDTPPSDGLWFEVTVMNSAKDNA